MSTLLELKRDYFVSKSSRELPSCYLVYDFHPLLQLLFLFAIRGDSRTFLLKDYSFLSTFSPVDFHVHVA